MEYHVKSYASKEASFINVFSDSLLYVYFGDLLKFKGDLNHLFMLLSDKEKERAGKFVFDRDREVYILVHGLLRKNLSYRLGKEPEKVEIKFFDNRKPFIHGQEVDFNLSHSKNLYAYAVSIDKESKIGVDIEIINRVKDFESLLDYCMHEKEIDYIMNGKLIQKESFNRFYEIWTKKEAFLKMTGHGIVVKLPDIVVSPGGHSFHLEEANNIKTEPNVYIHSVETSDFVLSVATDKEQKICFREIITGEEG